jgi:hypothetical protein
MFYQDKLLSRFFLFTAEAQQVLYIHTPYSFVGKDNSCISLHDKAQECEVHSGIGFSFLRFNSVTELDHWLDWVEK